MQCSWSVPQSICGRQSAFRAEFLWVQAKGVARRSLLFCKGERVVFEDYVIMFSLSFGLTFR
jgi:hypothetical protein